MKVLASDFDGTLFFKGKVQRRGSQTDPGVSGAGASIRVVHRPAAGGRHRSDRESVRCDFMILSSGAQILDGEGRTLYKACIDLETAAQVGRRFSGELDFYYQTGEGTYCQRRPDGQIPASASI